MICPKCENEYANNVEICPICLQELISEDAFELLFLRKTNWVVVYITSEIIQATMIKDILENEGINAIILNEQSSSFPIPGDLSIIKIKVREEDSDNAMELIDQMINE